MARSKEPAEALVFKAKVGERLRGMRIEADLSQGAYAARFGLSRDRYAKYEMGVAEMPYWVLARFDQAGVDIRWLITGRDAQTGAGFARPRLKAAAT